MPYLTEILRRIRENKIEIVDLTEVKEWSFPDQGPTPDSSYQRFFSAGSLLQTRSPYILMENRFSGLTANNLEILG